MVPGWQEIGLVCSRLDMFLLAVETVVAVAQGVSQETELFGKLALFSSLLFPTTTSTKAGVLHEEGAGSESDD